MCGNITSGIIAVLPAVLVLVSGIAVGIAVPLVMKRAHMQQQSSLLSHINAADNETGPQPEAA